MSINISALEGSGQADPLQAAVQTQLLKKSMELEKMEVQTILPPSPKGVGENVDIIA
ncbi:MAG: hypothetical protein IPK50_19120 [Fibrobacterota bacterium]|nr:hypothetical protein [Fibrobacterota bacterium]QQS04377.1 MAG: hypothetical protein IPK50_19120 [Fibrobacterota bacterium]